MCLLKKIGLSLVGLTILTPTIITTISCTYSDSFINKPLLTDEQIIKLLAESFAIKEKQEGNIKGYTFKYANHTSNLYRAKIYPNVKLEFYNNQ